MKYKNTKTGAIIHSSCKISGEDWEKLEEVKVEEEVEKVEAEEKVEEVKEVEKPKETVTINGVTVDDIKQELDAMGIKYNSRANKEELYNLMIGK